VTEPTAAGATVRGAGVTVTPGTRVTGNRWHCNRWHCEGSWASAVPGTRVTVTGGTVPAPKTTLTGAAFSRFSPCVPEPVLSQGCQLGWEY